MSCTDVLQIDATIVANEFIDKYMPEANGDYVKVYLYLLKNRSESVEISVIAEALRLTEGDVRRAVRYWEDKGIVSVDRKTARYKSGEAGESADAALGQDSAEDKKSSQYAELREKYKRSDGKAALNMLSRDAEFGQLLIIVQKYMSKILTEREQEVLAYLYDGLKLPCDVIDYLVAYCVEAGHNNIRYIEKTGLDWAMIGITDVKAAKRRAEQFDIAKKTAAGRTELKRVRQGITRSDDLDILVRNRVMEKI